MHQNFYLRRGVIVHFLYLDFAFVVGFDDGLDELVGSHAVRNFADAKSTVIYLADFGT